MKRTGIAVSDPLRIIASPLETVATETLMSFLAAYLDKETVDEFVVGMPRTLKNEESENAPRVRQFVDALKKAFPGKAVHLVDERFTSSLARHAMIEGGMKKKDRAEKANVDRISATIILQTFMTSRKP